MSDKIESGYTFERRLDGERITHMLDSDSLECIVSAFYDFLLGCGFHRDSIDEHIYSDDKCTRCMDEARECWFAESGE